MQPSKKLRVLLAFSGLLAIGIGAMLLLVPVQFHATNGIRIASDANLLSELRAPGGSLLALGSMMLLGVFASAFTLAATAIGATVYLSYGGARLISIGLDGLPGPGILAATAIELAMGAMCAGAWIRSALRARGAVPPTARIAEVT